MPADRRCFLTAVSAATLGSAVFPSTSQAQRVAVDETDHPIPISTKYDVAWAGRITARFRAVFDSPNMSGGAALIRANAWCDQYKEVYGVERAAMNAVLVLRADAIDLAVDDDYWQRFKVGKEHTLRGADGKRWTTVNPISARARDTEPSKPANTLESFMANGGIVLACGWAFGKVIQRYGDGDRLERAEAARVARSHLIPEIVLQPNGIFAILRAQEAGCHFVAAS